ncbi:60S ribosomal export protein NMD3 [Gammaproteobacteria bacterium]|nr:60S ribosomal export protein NMD3 [Gammaproteobacteria bacterium]
MFYPANHSHIFSCPLCEKTADALVCDDCYRVVLSWLDPKIEGSVSYWFRASESTMLSIKSALERGLYWPGLVIAHILRTYSLIHSTVFFLAGEGAQHLVQALNFQRSEQDGNKVQVDWFDQNAVFSGPNWVIFYD